MTTFSPHRATLIKRSSAAAAAVVAALALAGPVTTAGAATDPDGPTADVQTMDQPGKLAVGPTLIGTTFNGPTTIITATG